MLRRSDSWVPLLLPGELDCKLLPTSCPGCPLAELLPCPGAADVGFSFLLIIRAFFFLFACVLLGIKTAGFETLDSCSLLVCLVPRRAIIDVPSLSFSSGYTFLFASLLAIPACGSSSYRSGIFNSRPFFQDLAV